MSKMTMCQYSEGSISSSSGGGQPAPAHSQQSKARVSAERESQTGLRGLFVSASTEVTFGTGAIASLDLTSDCLVSGLQPHSSL